MRVARLQASSAAVVRMKWWCQVTVTPRYPRLSTTTCAPVLPTGADSGAIRCSASGSCGFG
ncbi:hypothetical protein CF166_09830 [Amycolatopsis sp. KNN50.9b]|nr:hypothetical protein CF166_09830 [Amycolatopsis sp. KNN50.9b]